jgi:hypothetical protein
MPVGRCDASYSSPRSPSGKSAEELERERQEWRERLRALDGRAKAGAKAGKETNHSAAAAAHQPPDQ